MNPIPARLRLLFFTSISTVETPLLLSTLPAGAVRNIDANAKFQSIDVEYISSDDDKSTGQYHDNLEQPSRLSIRKNSEASGRQKLSMSLAYDVVIRSPSTRRPAISLSRQASPSPAHMLRRGSAIRTPQWPSEALASLACAASHRSSAFCRSSSRQNPRRRGGMASCTFHHRACASSLANCRSAGTFQLQS
jgi:hypothetical protein